MVLGFVVFWGGDLAGLGLRTPVWRAFYELLGGLRE